MNQPQNMNNLGAKELQTKENTILIFTVHLSFLNTHHHLLPRCQDAKIKICFSICHLLFQVSSKRSLVSD